MSGEQTREGGEWATALHVLRRRMTGPSPGAALRPEELALLREWYESCEDPENRRELGRILGFRD